MFAAEEKPQPGCHQGSFIVAEDSAMAVFKGKPD